MKRIFVVVLCMLLVFAVAGCDTTAQQDEAEAPNAEASAEAEDAGAEPEADAVEPAEPEAADVAESPEPTKSDDSISEDEAASASAEPDPAVSDEATGETVEFEGISFVLPDAATGYEEDGSYYLTYECVLEGEEISYASGLIQAWPDISTDDPSAMSGLEAVVYLTEQAAEETNVTSEDSIEVAGKQGLMQQGTKVGAGVEFPFISVFFEGDEDEEIIYAFDLYNFFDSTDDDTLARLQELVGDLADPEADFFKMLETVEFI